MICSSCEEKLIYVQKECRATAHEGRDLPFPVNPDILMEALGLNFIYNQITAQIAGS